MKIGIAIDSWKLPIFHAHLTTSGFIYEKNPGVMDSLLLTVHTENKDKLMLVVQSANNECHRKRHETAN